jgi:hypothetical protein
MLFQIVKGRIGLLAILAIVLYFSLNQNKKLDYSIIERVKKGNSKNYALTKPVWRNSI